ncbi:unnamed protein product [Arctia plantaginis]|uniref:Uncharacterized protein n=1 Tax=Arctia plantaginis TaxID=874455 RepID=A0A8S0YUR5_ARCPL|nr:unnamed protein product [Arctia plantaginis]
MKVYDDCQHSEGFMPCLKKKAILFFDRAARMEVIPLVSGVDVVKTSPSEVSAISENDIDAVLPRSLDKDQALTQMLWDRIASFANSRTLQLSLPKMSGQDLNKGIEEGRGKMKKMMGMMMMGGVMKMAAMIPLAIGFLFILAGKALIVSKITCKKRKSGKVSGDRKKNKKLSRVRSPSPWTDQISDIASRQVHKAAEDCNKSRDVWKIISDLEQ